MTAPVPPAPVPPALDDAKLLRLLARMQLNGEGQDTIDVYKTMIGRSLEAAMPTLGALAERCAAAGERAPETARPLALADGRTVKLFTPETGSARHRAIALEMEPFNVVVLIAYEPPYRGKGAEEPEEEPEEAPEIEAVTVYRYHAPFTGWGELPADMDGCARAVARYDERADVYRPTLEDTLRQAVKGKFLLTTLDERRAAMEPFREDRGWLETPNSRVSLDAWPHYFPALRAAFAAHGLTERFEADTRAFAGRRWQELEGFDGHNTAVFLGSLLARQEGYLPGAGAAAVLRRMWAVAAADGVGQELAYLDTVLTLCRGNGHTDEDSEFTFNDLDNHAFAPASGRADLDLLVLRDQNRRFLAALHRDADGRLCEIAVHVYGTPLADWFEEHFADGITEDALEEAAQSCEDYANPHAPFRLYDYKTVLASCLVGGDAPSLLARLAVAPDGTVTPLSGPGLQGDAIRSWNSFVFDVGSAACCLETEYADKAPKRTR